MTRARRVPPVPVTTWLFGEMRAWELLPLRTRCGSARCVASSSPTDQGSRQAAVVAKPKARWLVVCSCGWTREASTAWAAQSVSKLHQKLAPTDVEHVTRVEPTPGALAEVLDGGLDGNYVWSTCSRGVQIVHPASTSPAAPLID